MEATSRVEAFQAGFIFPNFLNRNQYRPDIESMEGFDEKVFNKVPIELEKVFNNPAFPYEELERRFQNEEGKSPDDNLKIALHGQPEYVFPWFKIGQTLTMIMHGIITADDRTANMLIDTYRMRLSALNPEWTLSIDQENVERLIEFAERHRIAVKSNDIQWLSKSVQLLTELANQEDLRFAEEVIEIKPGIYGFNVNLKALYRKTKRLTRQFIGRSKLRR